ncbi:MAG: hypothetical protein U9R36_03955, partial [Elusimicrobiota bacterium]|nr:hypothetical protein [Elusimicrobiota bacterium]
MKKLITVFLLVLAAAAARAADWQDWELGGELGLGIGAGSKKGRIMNPALTVTGTRQYDNMFLELGA